MIYSIIDINFDYQTYNFNDSYSEYDNESVIFSTNPADYLSLTELPKIEAL